MRNIKACLSHNSVHWATPSNLYKRFMDQGYIDPCPLHCDKDNLGKVFKNKKLFINPPFEDLDKWSDYIIELVETYKNQVVLLMPARTDTKYFHRLLRLRPHIIFIRGRLKFNDSKSAPFPTILLVFDKWDVRNYFSVSVEDFNDVN